MANIKRNNQTLTTLKIKFCTLNICGLSTRSKFTLNKFIDDEKIKILALQETGSTDSEVLELNNMNFITDSNNAQNKGVTLYVDNKYSLTGLDEISKISKSLDSCWGLVVVEKKRYIIGNVYVKHNHNTAMNEVSRMLAAAEQVQKKYNALGIILTGDFNARHFSWGDKVNDKYGNKLVDIIDNVKYSICTSKTPTFLCSNGSSIIDLFIISNTIVETIADCYTDEDVELFSGSPRRGHVPVMTEIIITSDQPNFPVIEKLNISTMQWPHWEKHIEDKIADDQHIFDSEENPDHLWIKLDEFITEATNIYCQTKRASIHSKPYWTPILTTLSQNLKKARKHYRYRNTENNLQKYAEAKALFDEERKQTCENFIIGIAKDLNAAQAQKFWKDFNKIFKKKTKQKVDSLINEEGELLTENEDLDQCLFSVFFEGRHLAEENFDERFYQEINNIYTRIMTEENSMHSNEITTNTWELNRHITIQEIKKAIRTTGKSIDNYSFHPLMLRHLGIKALKVLQRIFNLSLRKHIWIWKRAEVIFLRKPGKESYAKPGSYRPICITSYVGKLLENIIAIRIEALLLLIEKTDPYQEGFSAKKNTIRYLSRLHLEIENDKENNLTTLGLFVDFEKAFDSVWKKGLMVKLYNLGIRGDIAKLIHNFLFSRQIKLNVNGKIGIERPSAEYGLPQGSVISPVLFKIFIMDFVSELLENPNTKVLKFADDGTIKISAIDSPTCVASLENALDSLKNWSRKWRLKINCDKNKTEIICFNSAEKDKSLIPNTFKLGSKDIHRVSETKVLGVIIDDDLTYKSHGEMIYKALLGRWATICRYTNKHWGFKVHVMLLLLKTLFLSKIWYADHIWQTKENTQDINKLLYRMMKSITGAVLNINQNVAEILLGLPSIQTQTRIHNVKHLLKIINTPVQNDVYKEFLSSTFNQGLKIPKVIHRKYKDLFNFLEWKLALYPNHFTNRDKVIVSGKKYHEFTTLSMKSCTYTSKMMKTYTEETLWAQSIRNQFQLDGYSSLPTPSCDAIPIPRDINRNTEVQLLSLFYKNNLLNQSIYNLGRVPSPLCSYCHDEEETSDHLLFRCTYINQQLRHDAYKNYRNALKLSEDRVEPDAYIGLLNACKDEKFIRSCVEIVKCINIKVEIVL